MRQTATVWPCKTRELMNNHMDSTIWNDFAFRNDDIVVATYAKAGTAWTQQIVGQLVFPGDEAGGAGKTRPRVRPLAGDGRAWLA